MFKRYTFLWLKSALVRELKTIVQCFLSLLIGSNIVYVPIRFYIWVPLLAGLCSMIMSIIFGLPEARADGVLQIDTNNQEKDIYRLSLDGDLTDLPKKKIVILSVDAKADLSHK